ncbi:hypothetical protein UFOVP158_18 [uncultured Caudovirales phage]|uniref:Uncharacterized protein n=1 Tax=uncultured Caudovirales phage TaxID=2100421 RepID=A0A6J7W9F3_9CAUD|nr:hypothetical protein UFOVP158_18 [uncultured Caudovirales phage]
MSVSIWDCAALEKLLITAFAPSSVSKTPNTSKPSFCNAIVTTYTVFILSPQYVVFVYVRLHFTHQSANIVADSRL